uniref:Uncharacterized protein n=1 Tax=Pristionchus pacificus TaxID=54126 RepID=A0A2A6BSA8_PRIPA|eukprot:PDM68706.1 hypothetical protein PRIPAC_47008 [Pristionchus pacificus]
MVKNTQVRTLLRSAMQTMHRDTCTTLTPAKSKEPSMDYSIPMLSVEVRGAMALSVLEHSMATTLGQTNRWNVPVWGN